MLNAFELNHDIFDLKNLLIQKGLRKLNGRGLFSNRILKILEDKLGASNTERQQIPYLRPSSSKTLLDPRCSSILLIPKNSAMVVNSLLWLADK